MLLPAVPDPLEPFSGYEDVKLSNSSSCFRTKSSYSAGAATLQIGVACVCQLFLHTFKRACSPIVWLEQAGPLSTSLSPGNFDNGVWQKEANAGNEGKRPEMHSMVYRTLWTNSKMSFCWYCPDALAIQSFLNEGRSAARQFAALVMYRDAHQK